MLLKLLCVIVVDVTMADVITDDVTLIARHYGGFGGDCPRLWHSSVWGGKHCHTDADFKLTRKFNNLMTPILQIFHFISIWLNSTSKFHFIQMWQVKIIENLIHDWRAMYCWIFNSMTGINLDFLMDLQWCERLNIIAYEWDKIKY